jgi:hypothetical protein
MDRTPEVISRLLLDRAPWDAIDDSFAARIPFDSPHESSDLLRRMVAAKTSTAHRFILDGQRAGLLITRIEEGTAGKELVCQAMFAETPDGLPITELIGAACENLARLEGCNCLRFHTCRPQMARFAADRFGYRLSELVMRKTLSPLS